MNQGASAKGNEESGLSVVSLAAYAVLAAALVLLVLAKSILATHALTIGLQLLAACLMVWARVTFGWRTFHAGASPTSGGLVTTGPYAFVRHPIYAAILLFLWAGFADHVSWHSFWLSGLASFGVALRILAEERLLLRQYPEYAAYARRTKRLIPFVL
jgi:protein-S-isoprenylcysteine O-methyltransferase Ste14